MKNIFLALLMVVLMSVAAVAQTGVRGTASTVTWTSATAVGTVSSYDLTNTQYEGVYVYISGGASLTAGAVTFEAGPSSSALTTTQMTRTDSSTNDGTYTLVSSTKQGWTGSVGPPYFQVRLSTAITTSSGNGSTTVTIVPYSFPNQKDVVASVSSSGNATSSNQTSAAQKTQVCQSDGTCAPVDATNGLKVQATISTAGLATSAKQPALGTAGSASTDVLTFQGIASGTPVSTSCLIGNCISKMAYSDGTLVQQTDIVPVTLAAETTKVIGTVRQLGNGGATLDSVVGAGTAPTNQQVVGGIYSSTELSPTTGQAMAFQFDAKGRLRNALMDAAGNTRGLNIDASNHAGVVNYNSGGTEVGTSGAPFRTDPVGTTTQPVQGVVGGTGLPVIVSCGTATEIQGNAVVTGVTSSNLTFTMADATTFTAKASNRIEIHSYQTVNIGATNALITFTMDNPAPTTLAYGVAPTSTTPFGGSNVTLPTPMFTTVQNKAMSIQANGSSTSIYVTVQGCIVP